MTTLAGRRPVTTSSSGERRPPPWYRRPLPAGALLVAAYVALVLLSDPRGTLGADTGIKVATLKTMEQRGTLVPGLGYWAAPWDPAATVHPFRDTRLIGDAYVDVTSLPMLYAAYPLWRLGGYRATLVWPIAGAVACAFLARAWARRLGGPAEGWPAFWLAGLASPLAIYGLDLWEHTIGVALMAGAAYVLVGPAERPPGVRPATAGWCGAVAGAAFGLAYTLRTEALVYGAASFAVVLAVHLRRGDRLAALAGGAAGALAFAAVALANAGLEIVAIGQTIRSGRATGAAGAGGSALGPRLREGAITLFSAFPTFDPLLVGLGLAGSVGLVAAVALAGADRPWGGRPAMLAAGVAGAVLALRLSLGLGFWPGLLATTPVAAVGLVHGWSARPSRLAVLMALAPVPLVLVFQFTGGALPQWGGRYLLTTGFVLAVVGAAHLPEVVGWLRRAVVGAAVLVTAVGVAGLVARTHQVAAVLPALRGRPEAVLIWPDGFLSREFAAVYGEREWLAVPDGGGPEAPAEVVRRAGRPSLGVLSRVYGTDRGAEPVLPGFHVTGRSFVPFIDPVGFEIVSYEADGR
jgi:hypothetical protein